METKQYDKAIQDLHEVKMKYISVTHPSMVAEFVLVAVMCIALVTLLFI